MNRNYKYFIFPTTREFQKFFRRKEYLQKNGAPLVFIFYVHKSSFSYLHCANILKIIGGKFANRCTNMSVTFKSLASLLYSLS